MNLELYRVKDLHVTQSIVQRAYSENMTIENLLSELDKAVISRRNSAKDIARSRLVRTKVQIEKCPECKGAFLTIYKTKEEDELVFIAECKRCRWSELRSEV